MSKGVFIVVEGSEGSGARTQLNLLSERLKAIGYEVAVYDFPRTGRPSGYFVGQYLDGAYGSAASISPYAASLFYALDRYDAARDIKQALTDEKIVLAHQYAGSGMAREGAKVQDPVEQRGFFVWEDNLEYQLLKLPRPNISLFLRVPAEVSQKLLKKRSANTGIAPDGHEADYDHLKKALITYDVLCELFPKDFAAIECTKDNKLLSVAEINNLLWDKVKPLLPPERPHPSHSVVVTLDSVAENTGNTPDGRDGELVHTYKDISLLLKLQLQRTGRGALSPELYKWSDFGYTFYTPRGLPKNIEQQYKKSISLIAHLRAEIREKLSLYLERHILGSDNQTQLPVDEILLPLTPLSALSEAEVHIKKENMEQTAAKLLANDSEEVQWAAKQLYIAARQKWPRQFSQPLESEGGPESINSIISKIAEDRLPKNNSGSDTVRLMEARPRQEFDLIAESIFPYSSLPFEDITEEVANWPYLQKLQALKEVVNQPGLLQKVQYKMDILSDQVTLDAMTTAAGLREVQTQAYTARYGFEVPKIVEDAQLDDLYSECFDESLRIYSLIQGAGREDLAVYATLLGHRTRWQLSTNAEKLKAIVNQPDQAYGQVSKAILEKVAEVHPLLWEVISRAPVPLRGNKTRSRQRIKPGHQRPAKRKKRNEND